MHMVYSGGFRFGDGFGYMYLKSFEKPSNINEKKLNLEGLRKINQVKNLFLFN